MSTSYSVGDTVNAQGKVVYVNSGDTVDIKFDTAGPYGSQVEYVRTSSLTLVKKATPPEPPIGSVAEVTSSLGGKAKWHRTTSGWRRLNDSTYGPFSAKWEEFSHDRTRVLA